MLFSFVCLFGILLPILALDLNIYKSVTEIRQDQSGVGTYAYVFENGEYNNIIDDSISWDGTPFKRQEIYNTVDSLKGALVNVRRDRACDCEVIVARIVDPDTMLLKNVDTGAFFYADPRSVEYVSRRPNEDGTTLIIEFETKRTEFEGTLSYLVRGITWTPNYNLFVTGDDTCNLDAYATIKNNQKQEYVVNNTYLYSGDLQLANDYYPYDYGTGPYASGAREQVASSDGSDIQPEGEVRGFYFYSLKENYRLRPASSIRLPFIEVEAECRFYYKASTYIGEGENKGVFERNYDLKPNKYLPGGVLTIRDNGVLVGQSNIPDVPVNYTQTITLREDDDVRYEINGNITASSPDKAKKVWQTYQLDVTISNFKDKAVRGQLDLYSGAETIIDDSSCATVSFDANTIRLSFELPAGEVTQCELTVTVNYN